MRIGVIASARRNLFASTLLRQLVTQGDKPVCVIAAESPAVVGLWRHLRDHGLAVTKRKVLARALPGGSGTRDARYFLSRYADSHGLTGWDQPLDVICREAGVEFRRVQSINSEPAVEFARACRPDLLINAGGEIFRDAILSVPVIGMLNAHMGQLPAYRGMNVMEWGLLYGDPIGVTVHFVVRGIDTGDILGFQEIPIEPDDTLDGLRAKSLAVNVELIGQCVRQLREGTAVRTPQHNEEGKQYFVMHPRLRKIVEKRVISR